MKDFRLVEFRVLDVENNLFFELKIIGKTEILEIHSLFFSFYAC
jgi:hypothetical protein